jgi:serine/threonine protein kinase
MSEVDLSKAKEIFGEALDRRGRDRAAFLDAACAGDGSLRSRVEALLGAAELDDDFLRGATLGDHGAHALAPPGESPGSRIGPYKLLQQIGEGGFGVVFMAEQEHPVRRRVALKVIKLGMDTRAVVARFEQERQALAVLDHPHIAKVLDAGATDTGRPYFVMELVRGESITTFCDARSLPIRDRLELLVQVCNAVQHAHSKGIIHRDIKPSNVLVSDLDARPSARVIDFGIAKATDHRMTEKTLFTQFQQVIGTPEYMSPEQAGGSLDIDTRTDVYSLGVMLYELLTGSTPFNPDALRSAPYADLQRIIREVEPPRPSTRISESGERLSVVAARRRVEPRRLGTIVRGELDWIVMKAMEKDRSRRYDTASALAADLTRYLAGAAITAAPPTASYRIRKFVGRNRGAVIAGSVVLTALVAGIIGTGAGLVEAEAARAREARQAATARRQAAIAQAANAFLNDMLEKADRAEQGGNPDVTVREVLDNAATRIRETSAAPGSHAYEPEVLASVHQTIGQTYRSLGLYDRSEPHLRDSLRLTAELFGERHEATALAMRELAGLLLLKENLAEADSLARRAAEIHAERLGDASAEVALDLATVAHSLDRRRDYLGAENTYRRALAILRASPDDQRGNTADVLINLGLVVQERGDAAGAESIYRDVMRLHEQLGRQGTAQAAVVRNNLAWVLGLLHRHDEAEAMYRETIELRTRLFGPGHPLVATTTNNYAGMLASKGEPARAEPLFRHALDIRRRALGDENPFTISSIENLASVLQDLGRLDEAEALYNQSLALRRKVLGDNDPDVADSLGNLASLMVARGKLAEAEQMLREQLAIRRKVAAGPHPDTAVALTSLAVALSRRNEFTEAEALVREALDIRLALVGPDDPEVYRARANIGLLLLAKGDHAAAITPLREAWPAAVAHVGPAHPRTINIRNGLGVALAESVLSNPSAPDAVARAHEAEDHLRACLDARAALPANDPALASTRAGLGAAILAVESTGPQPTEGRLREALQLLTAAYDATAAAPIRAPADAQRRANAAQRLVRLHELWHTHTPSEGHDAEAARWSRMVAEARQQP